MPIHLEVSPGELVDRLTLLEVKVHRFSEGDALARLRRELEQVRAVSDRELPSSPDFAVMRGQLKAVNETILETEAALRELARQKDFGSRFVELARAVYQNQDRRASIKAEIDEIFRDLSGAARCAAR